jgi:glycosyltransferase involved in cell wall biosynthesis
VDVVYFSICSNNYLAYARTLAESLRRADPSARFVLFLADEVRGAYEPAALGFELVEAKDLGIHCFADMAFRYDVMEFNTAIKPSCIRYLFERGADAVVYLDPDLYVVEPLEHVLQALAAGSDIVLTPHACAPLDDGGDPDDIRIMRTGAYNLGFGAVANTPTTRALVDWWARHREGNCVVDLDAGLFVDQKFMDLAPCMVESTCILRHPGYNVAYWNLMHRPVQRSPEGWLAGGRKLHFLHFSGVVPGNREVYSKHQNRYTARNIGELDVLLQQYLDCLERNDTLGGLRFSGIPYLYNSYLDGSSIPREFRCIYRRHTQPGRELAFLDLFSPALDLYLQPVPELSLPGEPVINLLMQQLWSQRVDLQRNFDLNSPGGRWRFAEWFVGSREQTRFPDRCYDAVESSLNSARAAQGAARNRSMRAVLSQAALDIAPKFRPLWHSLPLGVRMGVRRTLISGSGIPMPSAGQPLIAGARKTAPATVRYNDRTLRPGVSLIGYLRAESGVGEGARRAAQAMQAVGVPFAAHVLGSGGHFEDGESIEGLPLASSPSPFRVALMHVNADQTTFLPHVVDARLLRGKHRIGYWAWELAHFPDAWLPAFDEIDEVWTPSEFVARAVRERTGKPVRVMPHPVPLPAPSRFGRAHFELPAEQPLLLTAFDLNSYIERKNPMAAVNAYYDAFPNRRADSPHLVIKMHGRLTRGDRVEALCRRIEGDPRIHLIDRVLSREELSGLQQSADAFISLHRSEGFGLNIAECMAAGKLVVTTNYGGNVDFCTPDNSLPVAFSMRKVGPGEYLHAEDQWWAEPHHDEAVAALRTAFAGGPALAGLRERAVASMAQGHSLAAIGERIAAAIG